MTMFVGLRYMPSNGSKEDLDYIEDGCILRIYTSYSITASAGSAWPEKYCRVRMNKTERTPLICGPRRRVCTTGSIERQNAAGLRARSLHDTRCSVYHCPRLLWKHMLPRIHTVSYFPSPRTHVAHSM